jgi:hypothetical protein
MNNKNVSFVWNWYLIHNVYYISFDWDRSVGQMYPVQLFQDLFEWLHEGIVRQKAYGLLWINLVNILYIVLL